jgi:branched-chain amino acid transport system permease protein
MLLSLVALGFNIIFNTTRVFHLAHGATYVCSIYMVYACKKFLDPKLSPVLSNSLSIIVSFTIVTVLAVFIERLVYRPLDRVKANPTISLISSLGVYILIINLITLIFGNDNIVLNSDLSISTSYRYFQLTTVETIQLGCGILILFVSAVLSKSAYYRKMRAITDSYTIARKFGIDVSKTRVMAVVFGSLLASCAAIMKAWEVAVEPSMGLGIVLTASVAVIAGGTNSLRGTVAICFLIAFVENYSVKFLSPQWKELLTYSLLLGVIIYYRQGLVSTKQRIESR